MQNPNHSNGWWLGVLLWRNGNHHDGEFRPRGSPSHQIIRSIHEDWRGAPPWFRKPPCHFCGGFHKWGYPNSWLVYKRKSQSKMDHHKQFRPSLFVWDFIADRIVETWLALWVTHKIQGSVSEINYRKPWSTTKHGGFLSLFPSYSGILGPISSDVGARGYDHDRIISIYTHMYCHRIRQGGIPAFYCCTTWKPNVVNSLLSPTKTWFCWLGAAVSAVTDGVTRSTSWD